MRTRAPLMSSSADLPPMPDPAREADATTAQPHVAQQGQAGGHDPVGGEPRSVPGIEAAHDREVTSRDGRKSSAHSMDSTPHGK
jgi:hypothetical protein